MRRSVPQEGELSDEEVGPLLVTTDFAEGNGHRAVAVGLLDAAFFLSIGGGARSLGGKGLAGGAFPRCTCTGFAWYKP